MISNVKKDLQPDSNQSPVSTGGLHAGVPSSEDVCVTHLLGIADERSSDTQSPDAQSWDASALHESNRRMVLFPGSFDPFTIGHASLVERALTLFDTVFIAVGYNEHKTGWMPPKERVQAIRDLYINNSRVRVESYTGLTTDFAAEVGANAILRGVRSLQDFEYELHMADINRTLTGIETVCLFSLPEHAAISSSVVRELAHFGSNIAPFLPPTAPPPTPQTTPPTTP